MTGISVAPKGTRRFSAAIAWLISSLVAATKPAVNGTVSKSAAINCTRSFRSRPASSVLNAASAFSRTTLVWLAYLPHWEATPEPAAKLGKPLECNLLTRKTAIQIRLDGTVEGIPSQKFGDVGPDDLLDRYPPSPCVDRIGAPVPIISADDANAVRRAFEDL
jgi:hypothetical protein